VKTTRGKSMLFDTATRTRARMGVWVFMDVNTVRSTAEQNKIGFCLMV
jgi:hypothetical protein